MENVPAMNGHCLSGWIASHPGVLYGNQCTFNIHADYQLFAPVNALFEMGPHLERSGGAGF